MTKVAKRVGVGQILDKQDAAKTYNEQNEGLIYNDQNLGIRTQIEGADREVLTDTQTQNVSNKTISLSTLVSPSINSPTVSDGTFFNSVINNATINSASINVPVLSGGTLSLTTLESSSVNACTLSGSTIDVDNNTLTNVEVDNLKSGVLLTTVVSVSINDANLFSAKCIKDYVDLQDSGVSGNLTNHINDTVGAHAASAISNTPSGNLSATDQQGVNNELQSDIDTRELASNKGAANGYCPLGADQKVPAANLPSYVDDIEEYANLAAFPVTGESGKLYLALDTSLLYRWSGSVYAEVSQSLALGETSTTAYRGDRGKTAYDHSQTTSGSHGITGSFVGTTDTQVITNKDIDGGVAANTRRITFPSDTLANLNALTRKEGTVVYATDTDKLYYDNGSTLTAVGSGSGSGDLATYAQLKSDDDTGTWSTGNNATFLGGGSIAGTFTKQNATNPLNGTYSYTLVQAAGSLNDYVASDVQAVPLRSRGVTNSTDLVYTYDGSDNDIKWVVYDVTNATVVTPVTAYVKASSVGKTAQLVYDLPVTCTQVRFGAQVVVANSGKTLKFDDVQLSGWSPNTANLMTQESVSFKGTGLLTTSGTIRFPTSGFNRQWNNLASYDQSTGRLTATKNIVLNGSVSLLIYSVANRFYVHKNGSLVNISNTTPNSNDFFATVSFSIQMNAGDYVTIETDGGTIITQSSLNSFSITATAISDNVVQSWQPSGSLGELKFLPQNIAPQGFIPALGSSIGKTAGTYQGDAYYDLYKVLWTQSSVTAGEPYVISSAKGTDAATDWAANKTITIDVSGLVVRAYKSGTTAAVGAKQLDAFQGHKHEYNYNSAAAAGSTSLASSNVVGATGGTGVGNPTADGTNGTPRTSSETRMTNIAQYAFIRYGNDAPTLLALPTSKENVFSAFVDSSGNLISKSSDWILSTVRNSTGQYTINFKPNIFTVPPTVIGSVHDSSGSAHPLSVKTITSTYTTVTVDNNAATSPIDRSFTILVSKQSPDYTAPGVFVGNVAKNQVATLYANPANVASSAGGFVDLTWDGVDGDSSIVSMSAGSANFTLQNGTYLLESEGICFITRESYHSLYNVTLSSEYDVTVGVYGGVDTVAQRNGGKFKLLTITTPTVFKIRQYATLTHANGFGASTWLGKRAKLQITKLNGQ